MKTCVSINCPFILYCKHYNFKVDRTGGCKTQEAIVEQAKGLIQKKKGATMVE